MHRRDGKRRGCGVLRTVCVNMLLAGIIAGLYFALTMPYSTGAISVSGFPVYKGNSKERVAIECALTWDAGAVEQILSVLEAHDTKITFAVSGEWAERNSEMLRHISELGHEIATMGYSPQNDGGIDFVFDDVQKSIGLIELYTGKTPEIYFIGERNADISAVAAKKLELVPLKGTLDLMCSIGSCEDIISRAKGNTNGGDIILTSPTTAFSQALPYILAFLTNRGLTAGPVSSTIYH